MSGPPVPLPPPLFLDPQTDRESALSPSLPPPTRTDGRTTAVKKDLEKRGKQRTGRLSLSFLTVFFLSPAKKEGKQKRTEDVNSRGGKGRARGHWHKLTAGPPLSIPKKQHLSIPPLYRGLQILSRGRGRKKEEYVQGYNLWFERYGMVLELQLLLEKTQ